MSRVLVLWCPDWPVVATGADPDDPVAVLEAGRVLAASAGARRAGVRRGQRVRDAQRHCPGLTVHPVDLAAQVRCFEQVVSLIEQHCPRIEIVRPGLAAVPIRGLARYVGGEDAAAEVIRAAVAEQGYVAAVGVADGIFAAALAARTPPRGLVVPVGQTASFLAPQPITTLDRPGLATVLVRLGIDTLGGFAALAAGDVLTRFGPDGALAHRLAAGVAPRPLAPRPPGEDLSVGVPFDPPRDAEPVVFAARELAERLHTQLALRGLTCEQVAIEVRTEDGHSRSRRWRHAGLLSAAAVAERVRWQLDAWRTGGSVDGDRPGGAIVELRLIPDQLTPGDGRQGVLWGRGTVDDGVDRAVTRIQSVLGHDAVTRPLRVGGRGPFEQVRRVPWDEPVDLRSGRPPLDQPWPGRVPAPAPVVVPAEAIRVDVTDETGRRVVVSARCVVSAAPAQVVGIPGCGPVRVAAWTGPWPALERWWDAGAGRRLARFQMASDDGRAWLLFVEDGVWRLEAGYD